MSAYQRRKGHAFERAVARKLREATPGSDARRGWQRQQGHEQPDVVHPVYHVECKVGARPNMRRALEQAEKDCPGGKHAIAVCKWTREEPIVAMRLSDWLELVRENWEMSER